MSARLPELGQPEFGRSDPDRIPAAYLAERRPDRWRHSRRGVFVTAASLAAVIGLVAAPWLTLQSLFALAAAGFLIVGARRLLTERQPKNTITVTDLTTLRCCVCGSPDARYENYQGQMFCIPCANCGCCQVPCVRTGINADVHRQPEPQASSLEQVDESSRDQHEVVHPAREQLRKAVVGDLCMCGADDCPTPEAVIDACTAAVRTAALRDAVEYLRRTGEHFAAGLVDGWLSAGAPGPGDPDGSGQDPDAIRTDPHTTTPRAAEQGGHDPDTAIRGVQAWMALDLHRALGRGTNASADCQHQGFPSWSDWWADLLAQVRRGYAVAITRGVAPAGWYCRHCGRGDAAAPAADASYLEEFQRAEAAEAQLALARAAHSRLVACLVGFADVLDDTDRGPWANTGGVALADLERALSTTEGSAR